MITQITPRSLHDSPVLHNGEIHWTAGKSRSNNIKKQTDRISNWKVRKNRSLLSTRLNMYPKLISINISKCFSHFFKVVRANVSWYGTYLTIAHVHFINTEPNLENAYSSYFDHHSITTTFIKKKTVQLKPNIWKLTRLWKVAKVTTL